MPEHPRTLEGVARLLDQERIRQHLSIRAAAKLAGVPTATVQGWLNGKHVPTPALRHNFDQLVAALGLSEEIFLGNELGEPRAAPPEPNGPRTR